MRIVRVGLPALVGLIVLYATVTTLASDLRFSAENVPGVLRSAVLPIAIAVTFLIAALALARRSRAGFFLGLAAAAAMTLGGAGLIVIEIGYLNQGGESAAFAGGFIVAAAIWMALWAGYGLALWRARPAFAPTWRRGDRRMAIVLAALVLLAAGSYVGLGSAESAAAETGAANREQAEQLVLGTSLAVDASNITLETSGAGSTPAVASMTIELSVTSLATYELAAVPTLCLTDLATALDPAYKPETYCWGLGGRAITLDAGFERMIVDQGTVTFQLDVMRGDSLCAFGPGAWNAELRIAPRVATADGSGASVEAFGVSSEFAVAVNGQPVDGTGPTTDCIASTVSP